MAWASTSAGDSVSHARASTKKRTIALAAATSRPLPPRVADQHGDRAAGQRPDAEHVAAADLVRDRLVDEAAFQPRHRVGRAGHEARRQRAGDPPLVLELEPVGDRAGGADAERGKPPQVVLAEAALDVV